MCTQFWISDEMSTTHAFSRSSYEQYVCLQFLFCCSSYWWHCSLFIVDFVILIYVKIALIWLYWVTRGITLVTEYVRKQYDDVLKHDVLKHDVSAVEWVKVAVRRNALSAPSFPVDSYQ